MARYPGVKGTEAAPRTPQRGGLVDSVRRMAYASLGLFSVMTDEVGTFYEKCVTRGEQRAQQVRASTRHQQLARRPRRTGAEAGARARQPVAGVLNRSGVVTKSDMDALIARVDALAHELDKLAEQRQSR